MNAGRKRTFDKQEALDKATRVFWENGYAGTSLTDLTAAIGINKPSLYAAFGNKEQLFASSIEHYMSTYGMPALGSFCDSITPSFKERLRGYLYALIDAHTNSETPIGCFFVNCHCEASSVAFPDGVSTALQEMGVASEIFLATMLEAEIERASLVVDTPVIELSRYLQLVMYGLAVQAKSGKTNKELKKVAKIAVRTFPISG